MRDLFEEQAEGHTIGHGGNWVERFYVRKDVSASYLQDKYNLIHLGHELALLFNTFPVEYWFVPLHYAFKTKHPVSGNGSSAVGIGRRIFQDGDAFSLLFPFLSGGVFFDLMNLRDEDGEEIAFSSYECSYYIAQIVTAVRLFHTRFGEPVTHFDVGPYNFLVDALGKLKVLLSPP